MEAVDIRKNYKTGFVTNFTAGLKTAAELSSFIQHPAVLMLKLSSLFIILRC
tara:strand:+ start:2059 stop:2214 length:156 start_codon:yes stop_codon:yes gene_type:complete